MLFLRLYQDGRNLSQIPPTTKIYLGLAAVLLVSASLCIGVSFYQWSYERSADAAEDRARSALTNAIETTRDIFRDSLVQQETLDIRVGGGTMYCGYGNMMRTFQSPNSFTEVLETAEAAFTELGWVKFQRANDLQNNVEFRQPSTNRVWVEYILVEERAGIIEYQATLKYQECWG